MAERLRVGVIGAGYFARFHHEAWARMPDVDFAVLCDRSGERATEAAARFDVATTCADPAELFTLGPYDIIDIVTPPATHVDLLRDAVRRCRVAICQKPFCSSEGEAREAAALARETGVPIVVHENFRFQPWYRAIHGLIDTGAFGQLYQATFRLRPGDGQGPEAYLDRQPYFQQMERFLVHETAIHWIDVFRYLFGKPQAVLADLRRLNPVIAGEDAGLILFRFDDGFRAMFDGNRLADHAAENRRLTMGEFMLEGERGTLRLDGDGRLWRRAHGENDETMVPCNVPTTGFGGDCVHALQRHVVEHLASGTPLVNTANEYLENMDVERAVYLSDQEKMWINLRT